MDVLKYLFICVGGYLLGSVSISIILSRMLGVDVRKKGSGNAGATNMARSYGLVAGFVETGETLEEAVHREVKEETGIKITNLRYFSSQPWPYPCGLMVGFNADYVEGEIHLQRSELAKGGWFRKDNLPTIPEKLSIARKLIDAWLDG